MNLFHLGKFVPFDSMILRTISKIILTELQDESEAGRKWPKWIVSSTLGKDIIWAKIKVKSIIFLRMTVYFAWTPNSPANTSSIHEPRGTHLFKKNEKNEETSRKIVTVLLSFEQTKQSNCGPLLSTVKLRLEGKGRKEGLAHLILKTEL